MSIKVDVYHLPETSGPPPSIGGLFGHSASSSVIQEINSQLGSTYIGDIFSEVMVDFVDEVLAPSRDTALDIARATMSITKPNRIRALTTIDDFMDIPPVMQHMIACYKPVRELIKERRLFGFGIDPDDLPDEDPYEHIRESGYVRSVNAAIDRETGRFPITFEWHSTDKHYSLEEKDYMVETMDAILLDGDYNSGSGILAETDRDPTSILNIRG